MLIAVWSDVQQGIIDTAIDQWRKHLHSLGMCLCKWWTFGTSFVNKLLQTISIFHVFLVQVASAHGVRFLLC